jgi:hypothetical protein
MQAVVAALDALARDPYPAESFRWGELLRLRVGRYRIMYVVEGDLSRSTGPTMLAAGDASVPGLVVGSSSAG